MEKQYSWQSLKLITKDPACKGVLRWDAKNNVSIDHDDCPCHTVLEHLRSAEHFLWARSLEERGRKAKEAAEQKPLTIEVIGNASCAVESPTGHTGTCYVTGSVLRDAVCVPDCLAGRYDG